jgi:DNA-directed RNA polymerase specialized sigma24 family protein
MGDIEREADFSAYVRARQGSLARFAYLLTGDPHSAQDLLQSSLTKVYARWDHISTVGSPDAYVRKVMVNEHTRGGAAPGGTGNARTAS